MILMNKEIEALWPDPDRRDGALERLQAYLNIAPVIRPKAFGSGIYPPTARARQVLEAISFGLDRAAAAEVLGMSVETAKHHVKSARFALRAKTTNEAVARAITLGLIHSLPATADVPVLTDRERDMLGSLAHGRRYDGVAEELGLSRDAVAYTLRVAMRKLRAKTGAQAVAEACRYGLITY